MDENSLGVYDEDAFGKRVEDRLEIADFVRQGFELRTTIGRVELVDSVNDLGKEFVRMCHFVPLVENGTILPQAPWQGKVV